MFVRKKRNKSGTWSVMLVTGERLVGKKHPTPRIIKNFGVANDEKNLTILLEQANQYKTQLQILSPKAKVLKITSDLDLKTCKSYNIGFSDVYGHMFNSVFSSLKIKSQLAEKLKNLTILRIAQPASKRRTSQIASEYGISCNVDSIYKAMDQLTPTIIADIKQTIYEYTTRTLEIHKQSVDVLFYDLTTIYFETSTQDELRNFGFSKDGKHQHVQIMLAVIVTKGGLPIDYEEFEGNSYEGHTLIPVIQRIQKTYNIDKAVLVADAALMNTINLEELEARGIKYVIAARLKNTTKAIKQQILSLTEYKSLRSVIDYDGVLVDDIKAKQITSDTGDHIIAYHSTKRARKDAYDRKVNLEKIQKYLQSTAKSKLTGKLKKPYVKVSKDCKLEIDPIKLADSEQFDGFFGLRTNIKTPDPNELLSSYRGLWQVEQTFRIAKHNLEIRPVFHYTPKRIRAHFVLCYISLSLVRYVEFTLKQKTAYVPCEQFHLMLDKMRKIQIKTTNEELFEFLEDPPLDLLKPYQALGLKWHKKFHYVSVL